MKNKTTFLLSIMLALFTYNITIAQAGANDPTFNPIDLGFSNGTNSPVSCVAVQADGKILIGGDFIYYNGQNRARLARLNADESLDVDFQVGTGANGIVNVIAVQPDGKILIGGAFTQYNGVVRYRITRLNSDGSVDTTFNPGIGFNDAVKTILVQPDGKIIVGGHFVAFNGTTSAGIVRLNTNGSIDTTFVAGNTLNGSVFTLAMQPDGKIIAGGWFSYLSGQKNNITRFETNGTIDTTFALAGSGPYNYVKGVAVQPDGGIVACGHFQFVNGLEKSGIVKFSTGGIIDDTFNNQDMYVMAESMAIQPDNKIIITGNIGLASESMADVIRLNSDGTTDNTFITYANENTNTLDVMVSALQPDGKIIIAGSFLSYNGNNRNYIARLNADGILDTAFSIGNGTGADNTILASVGQPDGKMLIGGVFTHYNGENASKIARLTADGLLDPSFYTGSGANGDVKQILVQPDGKIIIAGMFTTYNGMVANTLARLNTDGSLDTTFYPGTGFTSSFDILSIALQADGKLLVAGWFNYYNNTQVTFHNLIRINQDGTLDTTFNILTEEWQIQKVLVQPDGKIIYGIDVFLENNPTGNSIIRVNQDGTIDNTFTQVPGAFVRQLTDILLLPDGKIMIAGRSNDANFFSGRKLARLNANGTVDGSFNSGTSTGPEYFPVIKMAVQADGKLIVGGSFSDYNGTPVNSVARINTNGAIDGSFNPGAGIVTGDITALFLQNNSKIIVAGSFTTYNGAGRNRIARITNSNTMGINIPDATDNNIMVYRSNNTLQITSTKQLIKDVQVYDIAGRLLSEAKNINNLNTSIEDISPSYKILIVNIKLADNSMVSKKIYY